MICASCHQESARIRIISGKEYCAQCGGFSEATGTLSDGILSRQRVRQEAAKYEGDTLNPWVYEKSSKQFVPNDSFIKLHGVNARNFFQESELKKYPKLSDKIMKRENKVEVSSVGETLPALQSVITQA